MFQLKCSTRRHGVAFARLLCLLLVVSAASRCTSDSITGGETSGPEAPGPGLPDPANPDPIDTPLTVGSVALSPDSLTLGVEESAQMSVIVRDTHGAVIPNPQVVFTMSSLHETMDVDSNGLVTGHARGVGTVMAWSRGVHSNAAVITVLSDVGSVSLSPESVTLAVGETAQLTVTVRDTTGAVIANPDVVFFQNDLPVGSVDSAGLVTGLPPGDDCGFGTIIARSGGVYSNTVKVVVRDFSQPEVGGCWDY
jgi:uncharacterized protein YjdB